MVHYGFYTDQYLGMLIPENDFAQYAARAKDALARFRQIYRVSSTGQVSENMALCAMAEAVYAASSRHGAITAATVGNVSVKYANTPSLNAQLLKSASIYLDIKRGVD